MEKAAASRLPSAGNHVEPRGGARQLHPGVRWAAELLQGIPQAGEPVLQEDDAGKQEDGGDHQPADLARWPSVEAGGAPGGYRPGRREWL